MRRALLVMPALLGLQMPLGAYQTPRGLVGFPAVADPRIAAGDHAHTLLRPLDALSRFEGVLRTDSTDYDALWRASREAVELGMLASRRDAKARWYRRAERYGRRAVRLRPAGVAGLEWLAITLGREALDEGPRQKIHLALEIRRLALRTLELEPRSAAAHHVLGVWHAEVRRLPGVGPRGSSSAPRCSVKRVGPKRNGTSAPRFASTPADSSTTWTWRRSTSTSTDRRRREASSARCSNGRPWSRPIR